jgi:hypothetical protein
MSGTIMTTCLNCGMKFKVIKSEYIKRIEQSNLPGLFHNRACLDAYRDKNRSCVGMKKRILELNKRGKQ